jgi:hypothetical protein
MSLNGKTGKDDFLGYGNLRMPNLDFPHHQKLTLILPNPLFQWYMQSKEILRDCKISMNEVLQDIIPSYFTLFFSPTYTHPLFFLTHTYHFPLVFFFFFFFLGAEPTPLL